jgi:hypothetical protein
VAIWIIERLTGRQMGPPGREVVPVTMGWERNGVSRLRLQKISPPAGQLVVAQNPCVLEMGELARRQQREKLVVDELG